MSAVDQMNTMSAKSRESVPVFFKSQGGLVGKSIDVQDLLLREGITELESSFRKRDFEAKPEQISFEVADKLTALQEAEKEAKLE